MTIKLLGIVLCAIAVLPLTVLGQAPSFADLERVIQDELKSTNAPGAAVAIVQGDHIVFSKGYGLASVETRSEVSPDHLFRLGSTSKMFTGAALATLAQQGKLKLDEPIGTYVKADYYPHVFVTISTVGAGTERYDVID